MIDQHPPPIGVSKADIVGQDMDATQTQMCCMDNGNTQTNIGIPTDLQVNLLPFSAIFADRCLAKVHAFYSLGHARRWNGHHNHWKALGGWMEWCHIAWIWHSLLTSLLLSQWTLPDILFLWWLWSQDLWKHAWLRPCCIPWVTPSLLKMIMVWPWSNWTMQELTSAGNSWMQIWHWVATCDI